MSGLEGVKFGIQYAYIGSKRGSEALYIQDRLEMKNSSNRRCTDFRGRLTASETVLLECAVDRGVLLERLEGI